MLKTLKSAACGDCIGKHALNSLQRHNGGRSHHQFMYPQLVRAARTQEQAMTMFQGHGCGSAPVYSPALHPLSARMPFFGLLIAVGASTATAKLNQDKRPRPRQAEPLHCQRILQLSPSPLHPFGFTLRSTPQTLSPHSENGRHGRHGVNSACSLRGSQGPHLCCPALNLKQRVQGRGLEGRPGEVSHLHRQGTNNRDRHGKQQWRGKS